MRRHHLQDARRVLGLTALDVGEQIGTTEERIFAVERGRYRPRIDEAVLWAAALSMPPSVAFPELFTTEDGR